ncbi:MAG: hypothetical protein P9E24_01185 [Candidatus Competibacter sp.]|nr:hypothetical protein [Candidatus Competibacter sp.]MDG4583365.1 hypothetical protein [Candidatus Competibacter sp.]
MRFRKRLDRFILNGGRRRIALFLPVSGLPGGRKTGEEELQSHTGMTNAGNLADNEGSKPFTNGLPADPDRGDNIRHFQPHIHVSLPFLSVARP